MTVLRERAPARSPLKTLGTAVAETAWNFSHLKRSVEQMSSMDHPEAQDWLSLFHQAVQQDPNDIFVDGKIPVLGRRIAAGFWFTIYEFETDNGKKVLKIGHEYKPAFGQLDPSDEDFFFRYKENLDAQTATYQPHLPHLILPQEVRYLRNEKRGTTLIAQPYVPHNKKITDFKTLAPHEQEDIIEEYDTFIALTRALRKKGRLLPDLVFEKIVRNHNLIIARMPDGPHLVLLDNGSLDLTRHAPILNGIATLTATFWPFFERNRFQLTHRRNGNHNY